MGLSDLCSPAVSSSQVNADNFTSFRIENYVEDFGKLQCFEFVNVLLSTFLVSTTRLISLQ